MSSMETDLVFPINLETPIKSLIFGQDFSLDDDSSKTLQETSRQIRSCGSSRVFTNFSSRLLSTVRRHIGRYELGLVSSPSLLFKIATILPCFHLSGKDPMDKHEFTSAKHMLFSTGHEPLRQFHLSRELCLF